MRRWNLPTRRDSKPEFLLQSAVDERSPSLSSDGRWLAYSSDEWGRREVYVQSFPDLDAKWQVSTEGGKEPVWSRKGPEPFYRNGDEMRVLRYEIEPTLQPSRSELLFEGSYDTARWASSNYDVSPDGERFLMIREAAQQGQSQINVVLNWHEELKQACRLNRHGT